MTVTPASTDDADAVEVDDKIFYPSTDTDTDTLVTPLPTGVEVFFQLRSIDSPERHVLNLELPEGSDLINAPEGAAQVVQGEKTLLDIPSATAIDAAGTSVEVSYEISGDQLAVVVPHRSRDDLLYPLMVDPIFDNYPWNPGPQETRNLKYWSTYTSFGSGFSSFFSEERGGVMNRATAGPWYPAGSFAQWQVWPIGQSYIEAVGFSNFDHDRSEPATCTLLEIWDPQTQSFARGSWYDAQTGLTQRNQQEAGTVEAVEAAGERPAAAAATTTPSPNRI